MGQVGSSGTTIERFANWVVGISSEEISASARDAARLAILDVIGVAVAASHESTPRATSDWAQRAFAAGNASIWFSGKTGNTLAAAVSNSAAGCAMDGDDTHWPSWMHSGSAIVPAALAAAEETGASWNDLLEAVVIGYEVTCRIAAAVDWPVMKQIATGHWCGFGAAAAVGRLRNSSAGHIAGAFSVVMAHRPYVYVPDDNLNLNGIKEGISWGTFTGVASLELAESGLTGPWHGLDHALFDSERILAQSSGVWAIEEVSIKPYASCAWPHAPVEAFLAVMSNNELVASDVEAVVVTTFPQAVTYINNEADPQTLEAAQYNIPFNVAVAAYDGESAFFPLRSSALHRPELIDFANKVELKGDVDYGRALPAKHPVHVLVKSSKGNFEHSLESETNPKDFDSVIHKFLRMTEGALSVQVKEQIINLVKESNGDVAALGEILRNPIAH